MPPGRNRSNRSTKSVASRRTREVGQLAQPKPPMLEQHQPKPGIEVKLKPRPNSEAPLYRGSEKLPKKVALINGGDSGIDRAVAALFAREGADVTGEVLTLLGGKTTAD